VVNNQKKVAKFHKAFGQEKPTESQIPSALQLRMSLIHEEWREVDEALANLAETYTEGRPWRQRMLEAAAKELADLLYVAYGTADVLGIPLDKVFAEVHRSNMSKLGQDGKPVVREDGKFLKGPNYRPADIRGVLTGEWL
jgi:predicted HAD superfamily Cof-like phosphohydrolase